MTVVSLSSILMTTLSPWRIGMVETLRSISRSADLQPYAAVLGQPPLGDIELGHDLDPGDMAA